MSRDFPGTASNYLSIGDAAAIDITGTALTVAAWVRPDTTSGLHFIASKGIDSGNVQYNLYQNAAAIQFAIGDATSNDDLGVAAQVSSGSWQHFTGRKNGTGAGAQELFKNGVSVGTGTSNRTIQNTAQNLFIGQRSDNNAVTAFDGLIAEVAIWNVALSNSNILSLGSGASPLGINPGNLKGYWRLAGTASPEPDSSGSGNSASIVGTVPAGASDPVIQGVPVPPVAESSWEWWG